MRWTILLIYNNIKLQLTIGDIKNMFMKTVINITQAKEKNLGKIMDYLKLNYCTRIYRK